MVLAEHWRDEKLSLRYPFDWRGIEDFSRLPLDAQQIPHCYMGEEYGWQYNPVTIAQYGLHYLTRFSQEGRVRDQFVARAMAEWLVENQEEWKNGIGAWVYRYDLPFYGPRAPWISGMAQGEGISLLLRMSHVGDRTTYENAARRAMFAFVCPVSESGVVQAFPDGSPAFEEYPTSPRSLVLNGFLFALLGVRDYALHFAHGPSQQLFETCIAGLKRNLARYDIGYWTLYDLHPSRRLANRRYQRIHVQLLRVMADITGDEFFAGAAIRWSGYLQSTRCLARYVAAKTAEKIRLHGKTYF